MKTLMITLFALLLCIGGFAQKTGYHEITEKRVEFIAARLDLSADEAAKFWPLFYAFYEKRNELAQKTRKKNKQKDNVEPQTIEEYQDAISEMIESKIEQAELLKQYNEKYLEILTADKVYRLYQLDDQFNKELLKQLKNSGRKKPRQ